MVDRITRLNRGVGWAILAGGILVLGLLFYWAVSFLGGDDGDSVSDEEVAPTEAWMEEIPEEVGPDGDPVPRATLIARAVEATIAAIPTPTPVPTPDLAATLQAQLSRNRDEVRPVVMLNPLDLEARRDPYLTPGEMRYFRELGPRLWAYTQAWLYLQRILSVDVAEWEYEAVWGDLELVEDLLGSLPRRPSLDSSGRVDPLVRAYADSIEDGMVGVDVAFRRLYEAEEIMSGPVGHDEREELLRITLDVEDSLARFDGAMSVYGCSVCGELFRREGEQ